MALCNNNKKTEPTPCEQVNPCNLADPCKDVENNSIIIKKYIDECCRTIYPMTGTDAVQLPNGNGNLTDALAALENRIDNLIYSIRSCEGKNSNIDLQITNLTRELAALQGSVTILLNGGSTEIENRIRDIEILITKINELLNLLLENLGAAECTPDFSSQAKQFELVYSTDTISSYDHCNLDIYKVKPGSTHTIQYTKKGDLGGNRWYKFAGFLTTNSIEVGTTYLSIDNTGVNINESGDVTKTVTVTVPEGYTYIALAQTNYTSSTGKYHLEVVTEIIDSTCPDEDDDSGSGSGGSGGGQDNVIEQINNPDGEAITIVSKTVTLPDVVESDGTTSIFDGEKFVLPPNILPVHGFLNIDKEYVRKYHSGYYLTTDQAPGTATPLDSTDSSGKNYVYSAFNGEFKKHIIYPIVLPDKTYNNCCLYPKNYNADDEDHAIVNIEATNNFAWDADFESSDTQFGDSITKSVGLVSKHFEPNKKGGRSLVTSNKIVNIYQVTEGCTYKVNRTDNEGESALYSIFGTVGINSFDADNAVPIAYAVDSRCNYGISEFEVTIPKDGKYLAICCHGQGNIAVYNTSTPAQIIESSSVTPRTEIIVSPEQSMTMSIPTNGSENEDVETAISSISTQDNAILVSAISFDSGTYTFSITNNGLTALVIDFNDVFTTIESNLGEPVTLDEIIIVGTIEVEPSEQIEPATPMHAPGTGDAVGEPEDAEAADDIPSTPTPTPTSICAVKLVYNDVTKNWNNKHTIYIPKFCMFYELDSRRFMYLDESNKLHTC